MKAIKLGALGAVLVLAAAAGVAVAGVAVAGATATRTREVIYQAFTASGAPAIHVERTVKGSCNGGSSAADRDDAWRCFAGNFVYDPCFSSAKDTGIVLCPDGAGATTGIEIKLTAKLTLPNKRKPSTSVLPWAVETTSGAKCVLASGASSVLDGKRANYFCSKTKDALWGGPSRTTEPWTIYAAPGNAKKLTTKVKLSVAWF
jgi:hypothetical protein